MEFLGGVFTTLVIYLIIRWIRRKLCLDGVLRIDHSNPEKDIYRIDIKELDRLDKKKYVTLKVDNHADLSQK